MCFPDEVSSAGLGRADSSLCDGRVDSWAPPVKVEMAGSVSPREALVSRLVPKGAIPAVSGSAGQGKPSAQTFCGHLFAVFSWLCSLGKPRGQRWIDGPQLLQGVTSNSHFNGADKSGKTRWPMLQN